MSSHHAITNKIHVEPHLVNKPASGVRTHPPRFTSHYSQPYHQFHHHFH